MSFNDKTYCASPKCENECGRQMTNDDKLACWRFGETVAYGYFCGEPEKDDSDE